MKKLFTLTLILAASYGITIAAGTNRVDLGQWSKSELEQLLTSTRQVETSGERIVALSRPFLGTPYAAGCLIGGPEIEERLVVSLSGFDCFTFLDMVEALRRAASVDDLSEQLRQVRYRDGVVSYPSRRHFFSDWVAVGSGDIIDVTGDVASRDVRTTTKQLNRKDDGTLWLPGIPVVSRKISYLPTENLEQGTLSRLQPGDYLGIYSDRKGLDVSHVGLLIKSADGFFLRHASSRQGSRRVVDDELLEYMKNKPGLVVYRVR